MKILLIGSGGREHALAWKLSQSPRVKKLFCLPGSDAIAELAECVPGEMSDAAAVGKCCVENKIDLVVVGPEAPLANGLADALRKRGTAVFGPGAEAARLESSKLFAKRFMARAGIATAAFTALKNSRQARTAVKKAKFPVVLKADGLAAGKGVRICRDEREALSAVSDLMEKRVFGASGAVVLLEEYLEGREASLMAFCDGKSYALLPPSRDHKRLCDKNLGPNTGGMGAYCPVPDIGAKLLARIKRDVFGKFVAGLKKAKLDYCGIIYAGLMLTSAGPKVIEFNCRFGDPETQAVLPLLKTDLAELISACVAGRLKSARLRVEAGASVGIVFSAKGYPNAYQRGAVIRGLPAAPRTAMVFHSGTKKCGAAWKTCGGRVLSVVAKAGDLKVARRKAYRAAEKIKFDGMHFRRDIGAL
jgi:phosphoribosylamine--glycine ligase